MWRLAGAVCEPVLWRHLKNCNTDNRSKKGDLLVPRLALSGFAEICPISLAWDAMPFKLKL
jgi:hypothetical protein